MTWRETLLRRILPLWAGAAALFALPHACGGFDPRTTRWGVLLVSVAMIFPLAWAVYRFTSMRTWRGLVVAGVAFAGVGLAFYLSARSLGPRPATQLPVLAGTAWLVVAVRALRDPEWRWADARRALMPGWPMLGFLIWAALAAGAWYAWNVAISMRHWGALPPPEADAVAWGAALVVSYAALFQLAHRASRNFTVRSVVSLAAAAYALAATRGVGGAFTVLALTGDPVTAAIADLSLVRFSIFLLQDELARRLPGEGLMARQRAYAGRRVLAAAAVATTFLLVLETWSAYRWRMSMTFVVPAVGIAFVVFCHLALAARLPVPLATKLVLSGLALFAAMDLAFGVALDLPDFVAYGYGRGYLSALAALGRGMTAFAVVGWSALCAVAHVEYRGVPLAVERRSTEGSRAEETERAHG